jgi:POT family proton-dependent oligopeptide transporter
MSTAPARVEPNNITTTLLEDAPRPVPLTAFERKFGHPPGLMILFGTEMWERFSYYGMRSLLVLYMLKYLFLEGRPEHVWGFAAIRGGLEAVFGPLAVQPLSSQIYGLYTGLVYLTPLFGGIIADRWLGQRKTVIIGGVIMAIGHFMMAFENLFFPALLVLILGNGCFKPNVSTQVGTLYPPGDARRDRAFSIFYVGINLGSFLSPLICGTLGEKVGWHYGFAAAGVGMCIGLVTYLLGQKHLAPDTMMQAKAEKAEAGAKKEKQPLTRREWASVLALIVLCALNVVFWAVYEQQGNTMQVWADQQTIWPTILGFTIPSTWFQAFNPFMIIVFTPVLTWIWVRQARKKKEPSSVAKMAIGCAVLGISFIVMVVGAKLIGNGKGSVNWLVLCMALVTIGELYLSPIGLSLVTKAAPARIVSMMMGMWFLSSFFGNYLSGYIGSFYSRMPKESFFLILTVMGIGAGAAIFALQKPLKNAIGAEL